MKKLINYLFLLALMMPLSLTYSAESHKTDEILKVGASAPLFQAKTHKGEDFKLVDRKGKWTVLYFYPKAETPGCTKQACKFRDEINKIRNLKADVFGISSDTVTEIEKFHKNHHLNFVLLADPGLDAIKKYDVKMPILHMSKRRTFIIDPDLVIRDINTAVDPVTDADQVAEKIKSLQAAAGKARG